MEQILKDVETTPGVTGCFVCDNQGSLVASTLSGDYDSLTLSTVGGIIAQTLDGIHTLTRRKKISDFQLVFEQGCLVARTFSAGCLFVLCKRSVNAALLHLTADIAIKKLDMAFRIEQPGRN